MEFADFFSSTRLSSQFSFFWRGGGTDPHTRCVATPMIIVVNYYCELEDNYLFYFYANCHSQVVICFNVT